ncbi:MAG TPA: non-homologous end-joining DNA ligase [Gemmatimonadales bacterium]|jgi:bifunctional non-homologous end joining protein LigD|nr:non-homologous end-joining DNA ligase [Gemmatimonadales bacterium]
MNIAGIELSNPDRVLFPEQGLTKRDVAQYYDAIASWMLPHVAARPFSLVRCPAGRQKACFYQKHWGGRLPKAVKTIDIEEGKGGIRAYTVIYETAGLVSLVQHGVLEFHLWGARADQIEAPDRIIFDLDPAPGVPWSRVKEAAKMLRQLLLALKLESWIKTTGGKGIHVVIPIERRSSWEEVAGFARAVAYHIAREDPGRYLAVASKAARKGRIFIDWLRNTRGATAIAPWSTRAREGAPISAPLDWDELDRLKSGEQFNVKNALKWAHRRKVDPWASLLKAKQRLTRSHIAALEA